MSGHNTSKKGGPGSGNFGHAGRPGQRGGSADGSSVPHRGGKRDYRPKMTRDTRAQHSAVKGRELRDRFTKDPDFHDMAVATTLYTGGYFIPVRQASVALNTGTPVSAEANKSPMKMLLEKNNSASNHVVKDADLLSESKPLSTYVSSLNKAVAEAPENSKPLFRGIPESDFAKKWGDIAFGWDGKDMPKPGDILTAAGVTSFTDERSIAEAFTVGHASGQPDALRHFISSGILLEVEPGAKALSVAGLSDWKQSEFLSMGRFRVLEARNIEYAPPGDRFAEPKMISYIKLRQESTSAKSMAYPGESDRDSSLFGGPLVLADLGSGLPLLVETTRKSVKVVVKAAGEPESECVLLPLTPTEVRMRAAVASEFSAQARQLLARLEEEPSPEVFDQLPLLTLLWDRSLVRAMRPIYMAQFRAGGDEALRSIKAFPRVPGGGPWYPPAVMKSAVSMLVCKGGPGSGNFGHSGRPGQVGGSDDGEGEENPPSRYFEEIGLIRNGKVQTKPSLQSQIHESAFSGVTRDDQRFHITKPVMGHVVVVWSRSGGQWSDEDAETVTRYYKRKYEVDRHVSMDTWATEIKPTVKKSFSTKALNEVPETSIQLVDWIKERSVIEAAEAEMYKFAQGVNSTTADRLRKVIAAGLEMGDTIQTIANNISTLFDEWAEGWRAEMIARTEVVRASTSGHIAAWKATGVVSRKVWSAAADACPFCLHLDGETRELDEPFYKVGDYIGADWNGHEIQMQVTYSDIHGPPLHPNCRCAVVGELDREAIEETGDESLEDILAGDTSKGYRVKAKKPAKPQVVGEEAEGRWVTSHGRHIFIRDGEDLETALTRREENKPDVPARFHPGPDKEQPYKDGKWAVADGKNSKIPEHIKKTIPPGWSSVMVNLDPEAELQVTGVDVAGRTQYVYSDKHWSDVADEKFSRINELMAKRDAIKKEIESARRREEETADVMSLVFHTGLRPGSEDDTGAKKQAYGATTLQARHVLTLSDKSTMLVFMGKDAVRLRIPVEEKSVAQMLVARRDEALKSGGRLGSLFPETNEKKLLDFAHKLDGGGFMTKDFRTMVGTRAAIQAVNKMPAPKTAKEYKQAVRAVALHVSSRLGNTPTVALQSYINPTVFSGWRTPEIEAGLAAKVSKGLQGHTQAHSQAHGDAGGHLGAAVLIKGEADGHPFRGNQYTSGQEDGKVGTMLDPHADTVPGEIRTVSHLPEGDGNVKLEQMFESFINSRITGGASAPALKKALCNELAAKLVNDEGAITLAEIETLKNFVNERGEHSKIRGQWDTLSAEQKSAAIFDSIFSTWATTAADHDLFALELQRAVTSEFGLDGSRVAPRLARAATSSVMSDVRSEAMRPFVRAIYENTQAKLTAAGVEKITLYRGTAKASNFLGGLPSNGIVARFEGNPATSWSTSLPVAREFAHFTRDLDISPFVLKTTVPASAVFSTALTGAGCLSEREVILLNNDKGKVRMWRNTDRSVP